MDAPLATASALAVRSALAARGGLAEKAVQVAKGERVTKSEVVASVTATTHAMAGDSAANVYSFCSKESGQTSAAASGSA